MLATQQQHMQGNGALLICEYTLKNQTVLKTLQECSISYRDREDAAQDKEDFLVERVEKFSANKILNIIRPIL